MTSDRIHAFAARLDRSLPSIAGRAARKARRAARSPRLRPLRRLRRRPRWGNLRRLRPFNDNFGWERGTPIDRPYLHDFFARHSADIQGRVAEIGSSEFSRQHGSGVTQLDIIDVDPANDEATILADLSDAGSLPSATFDCVVAPQTLQFVPNLGHAIDNLWQTLKPGGVALVTVPSLSQLDTAYTTEYWRMIPAGFRALLEARCPGAEIQVRGYGNLIAAVAFLLGLAAEDLDARDLDVVDPTYPMLACARIRRPDVEPR